MSPLKALMDILQQDRRESAEQRQELCDIITRLQGELQSTEEQRDKVGCEGEGSGRRPASPPLTWLEMNEVMFWQLESQCEQLQLKVRTLQLDWETEQKRSVSYFNQVMELEKERDQVSET